MIVWWFLIFVVAETSLSKSRNSGFDRTNFGKGVFFVSVIALGDIAFSPRAKSRGSNVMLHSRRRVPT